MEDIAKECSCIEECHSKSKYPGVYIKSDCRSFEKNVIRLDRYVKCRSYLKSNPPDEPNIDSQLKWITFTISVLIQQIYIINSRLEECTYANQFVKNTDYGKKYMDFREENSEIVNKIMSIGVENMDNVQKNASYYIDTYLQ